MKSFRQTKARGRMAGLRCAGAGLALTMAAVVLTACQVPTASEEFEGIGFREARFEKLTAMRDYRQCRDEALELDRQAHASGEPGRYRASAELIEHCESGLGPEAIEVASDERMHAYALAVQDYVKAGEVERAGQTLERFKKTFTGKDLYYADGSSFIETMEILVGKKDDSALAPYAYLNVNAPLKNEMRRIRYWEKN